MLTGLLSPVIVVPRLAYCGNGMKADFENILRHELTHYRRKDILFKWFAVLVSSVHWFNPLMILLRREIARACELSCDEAAIRDMSDSEKQSYGETLLALCASKKLPAGILATTLCEKRSELRERLVSIMRYKKRTALTAAVSVLLALLLAGCGAALGAANTNVETPKPEETITNEAAAITESEAPGSADTAAASDADESSAAPTNIITITESTDDNTCCIALMDVESVKEIISYSAKQPEMPLDIAKAQGAQFAVNGDFYSVKGTGITIRNGELLIDEQNDSPVFALFEDGTASSFAAHEITGQELIDRGCWHAFSSGTLLIDNGAVCDIQEDASIKRPRTGIGYIDATHYVFVVADGMQPGYSEGVTPGEFAAIFESLGCKYAYNLDVGRTCAMVCNDKIVNSPVDGGRKVGDILYITQSYIIE